MTKPLIGMNSDFRSQNGSTPSFSFLASGYYESIQRAGGIPVIVPPALDEEDVNETAGKRRKVCQITQGDDLSVKKVMKYM